MLNDDIDINGIIYANVNSKLTLKTKHKLDELAAQVAFWNCEEFPMKSNITHLSNSKVRTDKSPKKKSTFSPLALNNNFNIQRTPIGSTGKVKNLAKFFDNLSTPNNEPQTQKILEFNKNMESSKKLEFPINLKPMSTLNKTEDQENNDPASDFPEPPPLLINDTLDNISDSSSFVKKGQLNFENPSVLTEPTESSFSSSPDITRVSSFTSESSLFSEIIQELQVLTTEPDIESLRDTNMEERPKKLRRSQSFNDIGCLDLNLTRKSNLEQDSNILLSDESLNYPADKSVNISQVTKVAYDPHDLATEMDDLKLSTKSHLESLKLMLNDRRFQIGGKRHTDICKKIVKNVLVTKSLAEKINIGGQKTGAILGSLKMENIQFSLKPGFVLIDYEQLAARGYSVQLRGISKLYHVILFVRCFRDPSISESRICTLIDRADAEQFGLPYEEVKWLEMFQFIHFEQLLPGFRLIFDLYCMCVSHTGPKIKSTPRKLTPLKKLFFNSPSETNRSVFFTNMGSFEVYAKNLNKKHEIITKKLTVPNHYPFSGKVSYLADLKFHLAQPPCQGKLSIYRNIAGVGAWVYRDCIVTHKGIIGGKRSELSGEIEDIDIKVLLHKSVESPRPCVYSICAKANAFSMLLVDDEHTCNDHTNRRLSTDGKMKNRFLATADSEEDVERWCQAISDIRDSLVEWAHDTDQS